MIFSTKVLLSKTNVMQEKSVRQKKRQTSGMLRGLGCFLGIKWAVAVPIFTQFNFFPLQTYFYAKSHLLSMLKSKKSDRRRKKCDQSTPALNKYKIYNTIVMTASADTESKTSTSCSPTLYAADTQNTKICQA